MALALHNRVNKGFFIGILALPLVDPVLSQVVSRLADDEHDIAEILLLRGTAADGLRQLHAAAVFFYLLQKLKIAFIAQLKPFKHIRALIHRALKAFLPAPAGHLRMVALKQHLGHPLALPYLGSCVLGIFQNAVPVALAGEALLVRQHTGHKAAHGIGHGHGRKLAAGEDEIAYGYLLVDALFYKALVNALIVAAHQHQMVIVPPEPFRRLLVVGSALRTHVYHAAAPALHG